MSTYLLHVLLLCRETDGWVEVVKAFSKLQGHPCRVLLEITRSNNEAGLVAGGTFILRKSCWLEGCVDHDFLGVQVEVVLESWSVWLMLG